MTQVLKFITWSCRFLFKQFNYLWRFIDNKFYNDWKDYHLRSFLHPFLTYLFIRVYTWKCGKIEMTRFEWKKNCSCSHFFFSLFTRSAKFGVLMMKEEESPCSKIWYFFEILCCFRLFFLLMYTLNTDPSAMININSLYLLE